MSTTHEITAQPPSLPEFRCLRHHVWMAACDDCRKQRTPLIRRHRHATRSPLTAAGHGGQ